jgi:transcriptional regulator with XRE-family HTH domain
MARKVSNSATGLPARHALQTTGPEDDFDDLDRYLADELADPRFDAAFEDAQVREALLRSLVAARHMAQLTQGTVAETMGTTQSAVSELEGGLADPRLSTLQRYARAVGCRIAAWAVGSACSGDELVTAFLHNQGSYLTGLSQTVPYSTLRVVNGHTLSLQIAGAVTQHMPEPAIVFVGRIEPSEDPLLTLSTLYLMVDGLTDVTGSHPAARDEAEFIRIITERVTA